MIIQKEANKVVTQLYERENRDQIVITCLRDIKLTNQSFVG
jgi:hypothetical protein